MHIYLFVDSQRNNVGYYNAHAILLTTQFPNFHGSVDQRVDSKYHPVEKELCFVIPFPLDSNCL